MAVALAAELAPLTNCSQTQVTMAACLLALTMLCQPWLRLPLPPRAEPPRGLPSPRLRCSRPCRPGARRQR